MYVCTAGMYICTELRELYTDCMYAPGVSLIDMFRYIAEIRNRVHVNHVVPRHPWRRAWRWRWAACSAWGIHLSVGRYLNMYSTGYVVYVSTPCVCAKYLGWSGGIETTTSVQYILYTVCGAYICVLCICMYAVPYSVVCGLYGRSTVYCMYICSAWMYVRSVGNAGCNYAREWRKWTYAEYVAGGMDGVSMEGMGGLDGWWMDGWCWWMVMQFGSGTHRLVLMYCAASLTYIL